MVNLQLREKNQFNNDIFGNLTVITNDNGEIFFIGKEVASILGYADTSYAISNHCKGVEEMSLPSNGGNQVMKIIPERDLYRLVMRSKKPEAEKFEEWVTSDVLPSIRKHGMYATEITIDKMINDPDFAIELLTKLKEEKSARIEAEKKNAILMHVNKTYTVTEVAKEIGLSSAIKLNEILCDKKIQFKSNGTYVPYSKYSTLGYFDIKQEVLDNGRVIYHRRITQMGRDFIINLLK